MKTFRPNLFLVVLGIILLLSLVTDWYITLSFAALIVLFVMVLDKLGKGIVLREIVALHTVFICLAMPTLGYTVYTQAASFG